MASQSPTPPFKCHCLRELCVMLRHATPCSHTLTPPRHAMSTQSQMRPPPLRFSAVPPPSHLCLPLTFQHAFVAKPFWATPGCPSGSHTPLCASSPSYPSWAGLAVRRDCPRFEWKVADAKRQALAFLLFSSGTPTAWSATCRASAVGHWLRPHRCCPPAVPQGGSARDSSSL